MAEYVIEYDENSICWLINTATKDRAALEHGDMVEIDLFVPGHGRDYRPQRPTTPREGEGDERLYTS